MKIKGSIIFVFVVFMQNGGHSLSEKKGNIVMKKNGKTAQIYWSKDDYLEINDYCQERYMLFLNQWLKYGVEFIESLKDSGVMQISKLRRQAYIGMMR